MKNKKEEKEHLKLAKLKTRKGHFRQKLEQIKIRSTNLQEKRTTKVLRGIDLNFI